MKIDLLPRRLNQDMAAKEWEYLRQALGGDAERATRLLSEIFLSLEPADLSQLSADDQKFLGDCHWAECLKGCCGDSCEVASRELSRGDTGWLKLPTGSPVDDSQKPPSGSCGEFSAVESRDGIGRIFRRLTNLSQATEGWRQPPSAKLWQEKAGPYLSLAIRRLECDRNCRAALGKDTRILQSLLNQLEYCRGKLEADQIHSGLQQLSSTASAETTLE